MKLLEIFGLPGSGKSYFYNNFYKKNKKLFIYEKKLIKKFEKEHFYIKLLSRIFSQSQKFLPTIILIIFVFFLKKKIIYQFKTLQNINEIIVNGYKLTKLSNFKSRRQLRINFYFLRNLILLDYHLSSKRHNQSIFFDQFLIQLPYMKYAYFINNKKKINKLIFNYYSSLRKQHYSTSKIIYINTPVKICKKRTENRPYGRFYNNKKDLMEFSILNNMCLYNLKKNNYEILKLSVNEISKISKIKGKILK